MNQDVQVQLIKMALEDKIRINRKLMDLAIKVLRKEMEIYREILNIVKET